MKAVILAGGKGTRLKPYTTVFPKPLMPIGDKPILEIVIRQLKSHGFNEVLMAVGYLAELIMTFFNDGSKYGIKIKYSREDQPLGTAGPLALMKEDLCETFLMMNG
ncbi:MAG: nucleotidyltransferase family protein, partial [Methanophagales archaeon]|nr:nucleotidyltransferase family protein [Methanophagales archaeon]